MKIRLLLLTMAVCFTSLAFAEPQTIDLSNMTVQELDTLKQEIEAEKKVAITIENSDKKLLEANYKTSFESIIPEGTKAEYPFFGLSYARERECYNVWANCTAKAADKSKTEYKDFRIVYYRNEETKDFEQVAVISSDRVFYLNNDLLDKVLRYLPEQIVSQLKDSSTVDYLPKSAKATSVPTPTPEPTVTPVPVVQDLIKESINEKMKSYNGTVVDSIDVNDDAGTDVEGDYIVLVHATWKVKNKGEMSKDMLTMYSEDLAASLYDSQPNVQELAVFWTVPYLKDGKAKLSFERKNNGMYYTDKVFDKNFN